MFDISLNLDNHDWLIIKLEDMSFLKNIFSKKEEQINSYADFWQWFKMNEKIFYKTVKNGNNIEKIFFDPLSNKLSELREGFFFLTGMTDNDQVELIITSDGVIKNIVFVEEIVNSAPDIFGWKFTAMKPSMDIEKLGIKMQGYNFDKTNLFFTAISDKQYPDEIDLNIVYENYNLKDASLIEIGAYIFLDNYLGELNFATAVDTLKLIEKTEAPEKLIAIDKLKDFIIWREKEFIEKYEGTRHETENYAYAAFEGTHEGGPFTAIVNTTLMGWDTKASHPWLLNIEIKFGSENPHGIKEDMANVMDVFEDEVMEELKDFDGYLNLGRETSATSREIYFACKDFRLPSKVMEQMIKKYSDKLDLNYEIFKDKYWKSLDRFCN